MRTLDKPRTRAELHANVRRALDELQARRKRTRERQATRRLDRFGRVWWTFYQTVREDLEARTSADLRLLLEDCDELTQTNCWFATYAAREAVREIAQTILYAREREA